MRNNFASYFNSRPRVGGDLITDAITYRDIYFNSRPRVGGDSKSAQKAAVMIVRFAA